MAECRGNSLSLKEREGSLVQDHQGELEDHKVAALLLRIILVKSLQGLTCLIKVFYEPIHPVLRTVIQVIMYNNMH